LTTQANMAPRLARGLTELSTGSVGGPWDLTTER